MDRNVALRHRLLRRIGRVHAGVRQALKEPLMNVLVIAIAALCFIYLVYAMVKPERF